MDDYTRVSQNIESVSESRGAHASRRRLVMAAALITCSIMLVTLFTVFGFGLELSVNGAEIGMVSNRSAYDSAVEAVEQRVSGILGYEYSYEPEQLSLSFGVARSSSFLTGAQLERSLFQTVDEVERMYVLSVEGEVVGAAEQLDTLENLLDECTAAYCDENTVTAVIAEDAAVSYKYISADSNKDTDVMRAALSELTVVTTEYESHPETVAYSTRYVEDAEMYEGNSEVITEGVDGKAIVKQQLTFENGELCDAETVNTVVISEPVTEVIAVGTAERPPYASTGSYIWPGEGVLTSYFGHRSLGNHQGIDIGGVHGSEIIAADGGEVIKAEYYYGFGNLVILQHDNGDKTYYAHMSGYAVSLGDKVAQGEVIGYMGNTGRSTGTHLHFEIRVDDSPVDPMNYLPEK